MRVAFRSVALMAGEANSMANTPKDPRSGSRRRARRGSQCGRSSHFIGDQKTVAGACAARGMQDPRGNYLIYANDVPESAGFNYSIWKALKIYL